MGDRKISAKLALAGGIALLAVAGVGRVLSSDGEAFSYRLGAGIGSIVAACLLAALARWLWVRFGKGKPPALDPPWWLLTAGVFAIFVAAGNVAREEDEAVDAAVQAVDAGSNTCPPLELGDLGAGFALVEPGAALRRTLEDSMTAAGAPPALIEDADYFAVEERGRFRAALSVLPFDPARIETEGGEASFRAGALDGLRAALTDQGVETELVDVAGNQAIGAQTLPREYQLTTMLGCNLVNTAALDEGSAREALEAISG